VGLHQEAIEKGAVAVASNPDDPMTIWSLGHSKQLAGEFEEAKEYFARTLRLEPTHVWGNIFFPGVHLYSGRLDRAEEKIRIATQLVPKDPLVAGWEALLWAKRGETRKAEQAARRTLSHQRVLTYSHHAYHAVAAAFAVIGNPARALSVLKKAAGTGLPNYPLFRDDPHFATLRNHPEFLRLLAGLKREWEFYKREFGYPNPVEPLCATLRNAESGPESGTGKSSGTRLEKFLSYLGETGSNPITSCWPSGSWPIRPLRCVFSLLIHLDVESAQLILSRGSCGSTADGPTTSLFPSLYRNHASWFRVICRALSAVLGLRPALRFLSGPGVLVL